MSHGNVKAMFSHRQAPVHHPAGCLIRSLSNNLKQIKYKVSDTKEVVSKLIEGF
jgi:hypothetical protein